MNRSFFFKFKSQVYLEWDLTPLLLFVSELLRVLLERGNGERAVKPKVRGQVTVSPGDGLEGSLDEVTQSPGGSRRGGVDILNTSELQQFLGDTGSNKTGTTGSGDKTHRDGTTLASDLHGDGMGLTVVVTPVPTANRDDRQLGEDDGGTDGSGDLLGALNTKTAVTSGVTNNDESLEAGALTSTGLLLDRHDLHDLILEGFTQELVNDLVLFDGEREEVDLLKRGDVVLLYKTSELGDGLPDFAFGLATSTATSASATVTATAATAATVTTVTTSKSSTGWCFASHMLEEKKMRQGEKLHKQQNKGIFFFDKEKRREENKEEKRRQKKRVQGKRSNKENKENKESKGRTRHKGREGMLTFV